jgi:hypothetical protein
MPHGAPRRQVRRIARGRRRRCGAVVVACTLLATLALLAEGEASRSSGAEAQRAQPRCFGAAARDLRRPCVNRRLRLVVTPTPDEAALIPNLACTRLALSEVLDQCVFGVAAADARETIAMIGDSHAAHWRAAVAVVARARRWRVLEIARPHCPLSLAVPDSGEPISSDCGRWNREVIAWLREHPDVRTVVSSGNARAPIVNAPGKTRYQTRVDGYADAWTALPDSVRRLIVIRDVPTDSVTMPDCVRRAMGRREPAGRMCARPRSRALPRDAAVDAAARVRSRGGRVVDLTRQFCGRRVCFPVVGGVLVHKDLDHLTQTFASTLGPLLLRKVDELPGR